MPTASVQLVSNQGGTTNLSSLGRGIFLFLEKSRVLPKLTLSGGITFLLDGSRSGAGTRIRPTQVGFFRQGLVFDE